MRKISKCLADEIANKMAQDTIGKKITTIRDLLRKKGNELATNSLNSKLVELFSTYRPYFISAQSVLLCCEQLRNCWIDGLEEFPSKDSWRANIEVSREDYDYCIGLKDKLSKLQEEKRVLVNKIEATLLSLSTPKKIQEFFPEAYKYLPTEEEKKTEIALPIEELQSLLNKYSD